MGVYDITDRLQGESDGLPVELFQDIEENSEAFPLILFMGT